MFHINLLDKLVIHDTVGINMCINITVTITGY